jgi:hypothetical protein
VRLDRHTCPDLRKHAPKDTSGRRFYRHSLAGELGVCVVGATPLVTVHARQDGRLCAFWI